MSLPAKRNAYTAQMVQSESIGSNCTSVPVFIKKVTEHKSATGTSYFRILAISMAKGKISVKVQSDSNKRSKGEITFEAKEEEAAQLAEHGEAHIVPGEQIQATSFERNAASVESGMLANLGLSAQWYNNRYTFKADKVMVDKDSDALTGPVYQRMVAGSSLAEVPTLDNLKEDLFDAGTDPKYMIRSFILPLSSDTASFGDVELQLDEQDRGRLFSKRRDEPTQYVGLNVDIGEGKTSNQLTTVFTPNDPSKPKVMMKLAFNPEIWSVMGINDLESWASVAGRMLFYAKEWFVLGYSQLEKLQAIRGNNVDCGGGGDGPGMVFSTGFATKMNINVSATAKCAGLPLSLAFIEAHFGPDSSFENDAEYLSHPLNAGWRVALKRSRPFCINLTELTNDQIASFLKEARTRDSIKYYGVFDVSSDKPYEIPIEKDEPNVFAVREEALTAMGAVPKVVFAISE